jgi:hypothetical protein
MAADNILGSDLSGMAPSSNGEPRENAVQEMTELSATLMKDLNSIMTCRTASLFLFTSSDKTVTGYMFKMLEGTGKEDNWVGRMLYGAERFLNILKRFNQTPPSSVSGSVSIPREGESDDFLGIEGRANVPSSRNEIGAEARSAERWARFQEYLGQVPNQATSQGSSEYTRSLPSSLAKTDVPSTLVILNCYVCLLKIHEAVFSVIHHVLQSFPDTALPMTICNLQIDGFLLENHRSLQIRILIQVSTHLLNSVRKALSLTLAQSMFQSLLQTMIKEEGWPTASEGEETGMEIVWKLFSQIQELLP